MSISWIIDLAAIALVIGMVVTSYHKGLIRSVIELAGYVVAAVAAKVLCIPAGNWLYNIVFRSHAEQFVTKYLTSFAQSPGVDDGFDGVLAQYHISSSVLPAEVVQGAAPIPSGTASAALMDGVVNPIGLAIGRGIAFVVIFFLVLWIVGLIARATQALNHIPVLGAVNRLLGAAVGVAKAVLVIFVLAAAVSAMLPLSVFSGGTAAVKEALDHSTVYQYVDFVNPLKDVLLKR